MCRVKLSSWPPSARYFPANNIELEDARRLIQATLTINKKKMAVVSVHALSCGHFSLPE